MPVWDPAEISQIFDAISYSKGASVIRMLNDFLGESTFKSGIYLFCQSLRCWKLFAKAQIQQCKNRRFMGRIKPCKQRRW